MWGDVNNEDGLGGLMRSEVRFFIKNVFEI
jgi:hypothetical protein